MELIKDTPTLENQYALLNVLSNIEKKTYKFNEAYVNIRKTL